MLIPDNSLQTAQNVDSTLQSIHSGFQISSIEILRAVLSGDYQYALEHLSMSPPNSLPNTTQEKLKRVFVSYISFQQTFQGQGSSIFSADKLDINATIDRFEAVLYDMGDVAEEYDDPNTRIYLTIMAERLLQLAKLFQDENINNRMIMSMPSSLVGIVCAASLSSKTKMLYVIGLGLSDEKDITVRGLEAVKTCERVYLEAYTSILMVDSSKLSEYYGKQVIVADREMVESESDTILADADKINVAFLVVGDPYGATTHTDLVIRARELDIPVQVIHNASIMNAIGACGLQLYNFGQTISIVFFTDTWRPDSFYDRIKENRALGLHTLCLLDIKVKEQSIENLARGRKIYEPPRYMTVNQAVEQLLEIEDNRGEKAYTAETLAIGCARVGQPQQKLISGTLQQLVDADFGEPLHSLVIIGTKMHELEAEFVKEFALDQNSFVEIVKRDYSL